MCSELIRKLCFSLPTVYSNSLLSPYKTSNKACHDIYWLVIVVIYKDSLVSLLIVPILSLIPVSAGACKSLNELSYFIGFSSRRRSHLNVFYLADSWLTMGENGGDSPTNPMLITSIPQFLTQELPGAL